MDQGYSFLRTADKGGSWRNFLPYALLLIVTLGLYGTTLSFGFVWDDVHYVLENYLIQALSPAHLRAIWTTPYFGQYAPFHISFLALVYSLAGVKPFGYHLAQVLLHAACVCFLYAILKKIESGRVALLAGILFAVYPPNTETVAWISETKSTLAFLFFLLSFWAFLRLRERRRWIDGVCCAVFLVLSVLAKMSTVVAPAIFLLYDYREGTLKKSKLWSLVCFFLIGAGAVAVHLFFSHRSANTAPAYLIDAALTDIPLAAIRSSGGYFGGLSVHLLNLPRFLLFYIRMLFVPYPLSGWHMFRIFGEMNWTVGAAWIALLGLLWVLYRSSRNAQFWQLWFYIFLLPVLQIIPNSTWVADRYLYIPAIGAFVLFGRLFFYGIDRLQRAWIRRGCQAAMVLVVAAFAWLSYSHLPVWRNNLTFWAATTKTCRTSAYCHRQLGEALLVNGYSDFAVRELYQAVQIRPTPVNLIYLGDAYAAGFGNYSKALLAYRTAQKSGRRLPSDFWSKLARTYYLAGELDQASQAIKAGKKINPDEFSLWLMDGFIQWKQGHPEKARKSVQRALEITGQTGNAPWLITRYWGNRPETARFMTDLGFLGNAPRPGGRAVLSKGR